MTMHRQGKAMARRGAFVATLGALALGGCEVTNPGQILDADLNDPAAMRVLVNGMAADFAVGHQDLGWNNSVLTGDLSGTSAYLSRQRHWEGRPDPEDADEYNSAHRSLWVAESGIERMKEVMGESFGGSVLAAEAHVWAGYSARFLGETMCQAVIAGGAPEPREAYFDRAEEHFTSALQILGSTTGAAATQMRNAALGGRASVRVIQDDWTGAVADARQVPDDFVFYALFNTSSTREQNRIWNESQSRVNLNSKYTFFESYWNEHQDARARVFKNPAVTVSADGQSEHLMQGKYNDWGADIALTKGAEMRLIEAEALLRAGDWQGGLAAVNAVRARAGEQPWTAASAAEALVALRKERAVVLWLEGRRGGDLYRFGKTAAGDPILTEMYRLTPSRLLPVPQADRAICSPFSLTMKGTNPNLS